MIKFGFLLIAVAHICAVSANLPPCACARNFSPVCASDGKTYSNECLFNCERDTNNSELKIVKEGMCNEPEPCVCTLDYKPVCGTDGITYPNKCSLKCAQVLAKSLEVKHEGECEEVKVAQLPPCKCTKEKDLVCGSDGVTYQNPCLLNCAAQNNPSLKVEYSGPCDGKVNVTKTCICTLDYTPVCGTDGITYPNKCSLKCAQALAKSLEVKHEGECEEVKVAQLPPCTCTKETNFVCGSDGVTYQNPCLLNCAAQNNPSLKVEHFGPCDGKVNVPEHSQFL